MNANVSNPHDHHHPSHQHQHQHQQVSRGSHVDPSHGHNFAHANQEHFDSTASTFDQFPHAVSRGARSAEAIRKIVTLDKDTTTLMEFACGTGLVSKELVPYTKTIVGVDISQNVIDLFNKRFADANIDPVKVKGVRAELQGVAGELGGEKFDVVICTSAYHHFADVAHTTRILSSFLKKGGSLAVVDNSPVDPNIQTPFPEEYKHIVAHQHGFSEGDIRGLFEGAGLGFGGYEKLVRSEEGDVNLFIAWGMKN